MFCLSNVHVYSVKQRVKKFAPNGCLQMVITGLPKKLIFKLQLFSITQTHAQKIIEILVTLYLVRIDESDIISKIRSRACGHFQAIRRIGIEYAL